MEKKTDKLGGKKRTTICISEARKISLELKKNVHTFYKPKIGLKNSMNVTIWNEME